VLNNLIIYRMYNCALINPVRTKFLKHHNSDPDKPRRRTGGKERNMWLIMTTTNSFRVDELRAVRPYLPNIDIRNFAPSLRLDYKLIEALPPSGTGCNGRFFRPAHARPLRLNSRIPHPGTVSRPGANPRLPTWLANASASWLSW
jgi:hypothetical protein